MADKNPLTHTHTLQLDRNYEGNRNRQLNNKIEKPTLDFETKNEENWPKKINDKFPVLAKCVQDSIKNQFRDFLLKHWLRALIRIHFIVVV